MMSKINSLSVFLVLALIVLVFGPLLTIWALNTLFPILAIPYTFETWAAASIIAAIVRGDGVSFKGK
jgi:hypothetical protein